MSFQREFNRYHVVKDVDLHVALTDTEKELFGALLSKVELSRLAAGKRPLTCVVVEDDWPEYEATWAAIEKRVTEETLDVEDECRTT